MAEPGKNIHAAFILIEGTREPARAGVLLEEEAKRSGENEDKGDDIEAEAKCVFTTHTPVPAGHDLPHGSRQCVSCWTVTRLRSLP